MSAELEKKSVPELLTASTEIIKKYNILFKDILGSTPEESKEMRKILEGFTSSEIRDALLLYRGKKPPASAPNDMYTLEVKRLLKDLEPWEAVKALRQYRSQNPKRGG